MFVPRVQVPDPGIKSKSLKDTISNTRKLGSVMLTTHSPYTKADSFQQIQTRVCK